MLKNTTRRFVRIKAADCRRRSGASPATKQGLFDGGIVISYRIIWRLQGNSLFLQRIKENCHG
jgi:hypothetical protein